jgi:hypothetical protein
MNFIRIKIRRNTFLLYIAVAAFYLLLSACSSGNDASGSSASDTGALYFSVDYHGDTDRFQPQATVIDCAGEGVATIEAVIYDPDDSLLQKGGPWDCDIGQGAVTSVPSGSGRTVVILGKDVDGNVVFRGQKSGINVVAGSECNAGTIDCYAFTPGLQAPTDGAQVNADAMGLVWNPTPGATEYRLLVSQNSDLSAHAIDDATSTANYHPSGLADTTTYYWQVSAVDAYGNMGMGSTVRSFTVISSHVNNPPVAQITSPSDGSTFAADETIVFAGTGTDDEDGSLNGASLVWHSDVDGRIGTGETCFSGTLVSGSHLITLSVNDSNGLEATDSIIIIIPAGRLPDTDQTLSYTDTYGEDSDYAINPPVYTKLDASGNALDAVAGSWAMIRDDVTGLIWEVKTDDGGVHDKDNTYTWQDAQDAFIAQLNSDNFGGFSDWRLPTIKELSMLVHADTLQPAINTAYFPQTLSFAYWSSTAYIGNTGHAWLVSFHHGDVCYNDKASSYNVRAVRGGK